MTGRDEYYNRAKQEGYRARSTYKLKQLDETAGLFGPGNTVIDLGAAPGGWLQVATERANESQDDPTAGKPDGSECPVEDVTCPVGPLSGKMLLP